MNSSKVDQAALTLVQVVLYISIAMSALSCLLPLAILGGEIMADAGILAKFAACLGCLLVSAMGAAFNYGLYVAISRAKAFPKHERELQAAFEELSLTLVQRERELTLQEQNRLEILKSRRNPYWSVWAD